jgi:DNA-binding NarL/FixJ family response regulator
MSPFKVLIVEDYKPFCELIRSMLRSPALEIVDEAADGLEGVQKAEELQPDLILLDIGLPKLSGMKAAQKMRGVAPNSKILFLSQESAPDFVEEAFKLGALGYVHKPRVQKELLPAVRSALLGKPYTSDGLEGCVPPKNGHRIDGHEVLFFSDEEVLLDQFAEFLGNALAKKCPTISVVTPSQRVRLIERLRTRAADVDNSMRQGTCVWVDPAEVLDPLQFVQIVRSWTKPRSKDEPPGRLHFACCGVRAGCLWASGKLDEALELEQFCSSFAESYQVSMLCAYPLTSLDGVESEFATISAEHSSIRSC